MAAACISSSMDMETCSRQSSVLRYGEVHDHEASRLTQQCIYEIL